MRKMRALPGVMTAAALTLLAGCAGQEPLPESITCTTQYRPEAEGSGDWEEPEVRVALNSTERVDFEVMSLHVHYSGDQPDGNAARVVVTDAAEDVITETLYQHDGTGEQLGTEWVGGTSFTGLTYVHHDGALLQVMCGAD